MNWDDVKNRKEESIRESTNNPMNNSLENEFEKYKSYTDFLNSDEYKELLSLEEKANEQYKIKAKEFFESLELDNQLLIFYHITNSIFENYFKSSGSYRALLYDKLGFGPEAYSLGLDSGMFAVHNAIYTPDELAENFNKLISHLKLDLTKAQKVSLYNILVYGFDTSKTLEDIISGQQKFDFTKDPE